jgi:hypothetical protein
MSLDPACPHWRYKPLTGSYRDLIPERAAEVLRAGRGIVHYRG